MPLGDPPALPGLKKKGLTIPAKHVSTFRSKEKAKKRSGKKGAAKTNATKARKAGRPPKKKSVIDAILDENKDLSAKEVQDKAAEQKVKVSTQSIYNNSTWKALHSNGKTPRKGSPPKKRSAKVSASSANGLQGDFTRCVKGLGIAKARELLEVIAAYENA